MSVYITYKEIFSGTEFDNNNLDTFHAKLKQFHFLDLLQSLAKTNYLLNDIYFQHNPIEPQLAQGLFEKAIF